MACLHTITPSVHHIALLIWNKWCSKCWAPKQAQHYLWLLYRWFCLLSIRTAECWQCKKRPVFVLVTLVVLHLFGDKYWFLHPCLLRLVHTGSKIYMKGLLNFLKCLDGEFLNFQPQFWNKLHLQFKSKQRCIVSSSEIQWTKTNQIFCWAAADNLSRWRHTLDPLSYRLEVWNMCGNMSTMV